MAGSRILWVDDDAMGVLSPVAQELRRCKCQVDIAMDLETGMDAIAKSTARTDDYTAVLADIVLPKGRLEPGISRYLGMSIAQAAASAGRVRHVGFLTVVSFKEVATRFEDLRAKHKSIKFKYFNKADLLYPSTLQQLSDFVRVDCEARKK